MTRPPSPRPVAAVVTPAATGRLHAACFVDEAGRFRVGLTQDFVAVEPLPQTFTTPGAACRFAEKVEAGR